jgi:hypothetical protein
MSGQGFGKTSQTLPVKAKGKKGKDKLQSYSLCHVGRDGVVRILELEAKSDEQAFKKFSAFVDILNLYLSNATDEEILNFIERNPIDDGGEA